MGRNPTSDDRPPNPCDTCGGKATIVKLTGKKDAAGNPTTEKVTCPSCRGRGTKGGR